LLTDTDIRALIKSGEIKIAPFEEECLTPVGYDLRVGEYGVSWKKRRLFSLKDEKQITIDPGDTVLLSVREKIEVSKNIGGTIHSKVSLVSRGYSHISTTVDPGWKGELTILISNTRTTPLTLKFEQPFCTLVLHKSASPATKEAPGPRALPEFFKSLLELEEKLSWKRRIRNALTKKPSILAASVLIGYGVTLGVFGCFWFVFRIETNATIVSAIIGSGTVLSAAIMSKF
jgi:dCTP deaminase